MPSQEPIHLFVYGTLTDPERVTALTGQQFERVNASLSDFERVNSPLGYPFILPKIGAVVDGVLLLNIDPVSLRQLDAYEAEGDLYRRQSVVVQVVDRPVAAATYVGHAIRAVVASSPLEVIGDAPPPTRRLRAPFADEH
jgi:gamma-glutamylcyclotransferase (GGCT)/AIG2-like uncharacterized protein YtfP